MDVSVTAMAAPKPAALMSAGVQVVPQRSVLDPKVAVVAVVGHTAPAECSVPLIVPPFTILMLLSLIAPKAAVPSFRVTETSIPLMIDCGGMAKFIPDATR